MITSGLKIGTGGAHKSALISASLPVATEVHRLLSPKYKLHDPLNLLAIGGAAVVFTPSGFLSKPQRGGRWYGDYVRYHRCASG